MTASWPKFPPTTTPTTTLVFVLVFVGGGDVTIKVVKDGFPGSYLACKNPHNYHTLNYFYWKVNYMRKKLVLCTKQNSKH